MICPYCKRQDCIEQHAGTWIYCNCRRELYKHPYYLKHQYVEKYMSITTIKQLKEAPYRIQGMRAHHYENTFEDNKAYETFDEAEQAANVQASNKGNVKRGNRFIVYKAIAVVGPQPVIEPPLETIMLGEI